MTDDTADATLAGSRRLNPLAWGARPKTRRMYGARGVQWALAAFRIHRAVTKPGAGTIFAAAGSVLTALSLHCHDSGEDSLGLAGW
jgi:hypothetical protein